MEVAIVLTIIVMIVLTIVASVSAWGIACRHETRKLRRELIQSGVIKAD